MFSRFVTLSPTYSSLSQYSILFVSGASEDEDTEEDGASGGLSMEAAGADTYPCTYCGIAFVTHHELKVHPTQLFANILN